MRWEPFELLGHYLRGAPLCPTQLWQEGEKVKPYGEQGKDGLVYALFSRPLGARARIRFMSRSTHKRVSPSFVIVSHSRTLVASNNQGV